MMIVLLYRKRHVRTGNYKQPSRLLSGFWVRLSSRCIISGNREIDYRCDYRFLLFFFIYLFLFWQHALSLLTFSLLWNDVSNPVRLLGVQKTDTFVPPLFFSKIPANDVRARTSYLWEIRRKNAPSFLFQALWASPFLTRLISCTSSMMVA